MTTWNKKPNAFCVFKVFVHFCCFENYIQYQVVLDRFRDSAGLVLETIDDCCCCCRVFVIYFFYVIGSVFFPHSHTHTFRLADLCTTFDNQRYFFSVAVSFLFLFHSIFFFFLSPCVILFFFLGCREATFELVWCQRRMCTNRPDGVMC